MNTRYSFIHDCDFQLMNYVFNRYGENFFLHNNLCSEALKNKIKGTETIINRLYNKGFIQKYSILENIEGKTLVHEMTNRVKLKYCLTSKATHFIQHFQDRKHLFEYCDLNDSNVTSLFIFLNDNESMNVNSFRQKFVQEVYNSHEPMTDYWINKTYTVLDKLCKSNLITKKKPTEESENKYSITELGKSVLDLINDMNTFLKDEIIKERKVHNIETKYKSVLMFPLWV